MFALFAPIARLFTEATSPVSAGIARRLLESAGARHDSRDAEDLRIAAYAYLSVIR